MYKIIGADSREYGPINLEQLAEWVKLMDVVGMEKAVIFTGASAGEKFAEVQKVYAKYPGRFDLWCGFDMSGSEQPGFGPGAVKALGRAAAALFSSGGVRTAPGPVRLRAVLDPAVDDLQGAVHVLLDQQDRQPIGPQFADDRKDHLDQQGSQP